MTTGFESLLSKPPFINDYHFSALQLIDKVIHSKVPERTNSVEFQLKAKTRDARMIFDV